MYISPEDPRAASAIKAIKAGDFRALVNIIEENPDLATAYIGTPTEARTLLHITTDHPGKLRNVTALIHVIVFAGADVNARFIGAQHQETPMHWAASCDDVSAINALMDQNADENATGGVIADGTPLDNAVAFRQWRAAKRLVERSAKVNLRNAAALGLMDYLREVVGDDGTLGKEEKKPSKEELDHAFWYACHGGQLQAAQFLRERGADVHVIPPWSEGSTTFDAVKDEGPDGTDPSGLRAWLRSLGVTSSE